MKIEPELFAKISTFILASALGAQKVFPEEAPITLVETGYAALGGLAAGIMLIRVADPSRNFTLLDKAYTVLFSAVIGALVGPGLTNWATSAASWIHEGNLENAPGGFVGGVFVPLGFGVVISVLRYGQKHPEAVLAILTTAKKRISNAKKAIFDR